MPLISAAQIARVASKAAPHVVNAIVDRADDVLPRHGLVTPLRLQHFLAQVLVETGYLHLLEEDLSYSAKRLTQVWPKRFPTLAAAEPYAHRPRELADLVYGGRMGNRLGTDDGFACRGMGLLQNTGMAGRERLAKILHAAPDQISAMLIDDGWMLECAAADFVALGCLPHADHDDVEGVTRCINGGLTDLAGRRAALKLCARVWTPSAVIAPAALVPKPTAPPHPETPTVTTSATAKNAAVAALERIARDPNTMASIEHGIADLQTVASAIPNSGPLSGYKTYIVAGLGIAATLALGVHDMVDAGGFTVPGVFALLSDLWKGGLFAGIATLRAALAGNHAATTDNIAAVGQGIVMQLAAPAAAAVAGPAEAIGGMLGAVEDGVGSLLPRG